MRRGAGAPRVRRGASRALVERLGGHPAARWGIDLEREAGRRTWLAAACLRGRTARCPLAADCPRLGRGADA